MGGEQSGEQSSEQGKGVPLSISSMKTKAEEMARGKSTPDQIRAKLIASFGADRAVLLEIDRVVAEVTSGRRYEDKPVVMEKSAKPVDNSEVEKVAAVEALVESGLTEDQIRAAVDAAIKATLEKATDEDLRKAVREAVKNVAKDTGKAPDESTIGNVARKATRKVAEKAPDEKNVEGVAKEAEKEKEGAEKTPNKEQPTLEEKVGELWTAGLTAEQRKVVIEEAIKASPKAKEAGKGDDIDPRLNVDGNTKDAMDAVEQSPSLSKGVKVLKEAGSEVQVALTKDKEGGVNPINAEVLSVGRRKELESDDYGKGGHVPSKVAETLKKNTTEPITVLSERSRYEGDVSSGNLFSNVRTPTQRGEGTKKDSLRK